MGVVKHSGLPTPAVKAKPLTLLKCKVTTTSSSTIPTEMPPGPRTPWAREVRTATSDSKMMVTSFSTPLMDLQFGAPVPMVDKNPVNLELAKCVCDQPLKDHPEPESKIDHKNDLFLWIISFYSQNSLIID